MITSVTPVRPRNTSKRFHLNNTTTHAEMGIASPQVHKSKAAGASES